MFQSIKDITDRKQQRRVEATYSCKCTVKFTTPGIADPAGFLYNQPAQMDGVIRVHYLHRCPECEKMS